MTDTHVAKYQRSTRVLTHPDGSFTVEFLVEVKVVERGQEFALPTTVKRWATDPGFAIQPGFVGQHTDENAAIARAYHLANVEPEDAIYADITKMYLREEDKMAKGLVN